MREKHHDCNIHEGGVRVVELKKAPVETTLDTKHAIDGSTASIEEVMCQNMGCENYRICVLLRPKSNRKYQVIKVLGDMECPEGKNLKRVLLGE